MSTKEKLIDRFCKMPKDFTYEETLKVLSAFGYNEHNKGATSGSRVRFKMNKRDSILIFISHIQVV